MNTSINCLAEQVLNYSCLVYFRFILTHWRLVPSILSILSLGSTGNACYSYKIISSSMGLKTLFNIVEDQFQKIVELWCLCCIMMFRRINKQRGIQFFWNWCSHYQEIYDWISPLNKRSGSPFILTQQSMGENEYVESDHLSILFFWST